MRRSVLIVAMAGIFAVTASAAYGVQRGQGGGPKPKPASAGGQAPKVQSPAAQGPKVKPSASAMQPRGNPGGTRKTPGPAMKPTGASTKAANTSKTHPVKTSPTKTTTTAANTTKGKSANAGAKSAKGSTSKTTTTETRTTSGGTGPTTTLTPVQQKLQKNTQLASKLEGRLPPGTNLLEAAEGFRNLGQFVAAVNVSRNLGIPFEQLKMRMVDDKMSLGQAIKVERPLANTDYELRRAEGDADRMIRTDPTLTSTSTTAPSKTKSTSRTRTSGTR